MKPPSIHPQSLSDYIETILARRLFLPLVSILVFIALVGTWIATNQLRAQQETHARIIARHTGEYVQNAERVLKTLALSLPSIHTDDRQTQVVLEVVDQAFPYFDALYCVDYRGNITNFVSKRSGKTVQSVPDAPYLHPRNRNQRPYISPPLISPITGHTTIYFSYPLGNDQLVVGELQMEALQEATMFNGYSPGDTRESTFILDADGHLLTPSQEVLTGQNTTWQKFPILQYKKQDDVWTATYSYQKTWYYGAAAQVPAITPWYVVIQTPWLAIMRLPIALLGGTLALFIVSGFTLSRGIRKDFTGRIVGPLRILGQQAKALGEGHYTLVSRELTIPNTFKELQALVHGFGEMAFAIQQREKELEEKGKQYRLLVDTSPDAIVLVSAYGEILLCNPQAARLYQADSPEEMEGLHVSQLVSPLELTRLEDALQQLRKKGRLDNVALHLKRRDGSIYPAEATVAALTTSNGTSERYIIIARDISERERQAAFAAFINEVTSMALQSTGFTAILQTIADKLQEYFHATTCYITQWDDQRALTIPTVASGHMKHLYPTLAARPQEGTLSRAVIQAGEPVAIEDVHNSPMVAPDIAVTIPETSFLALPLVSGEQKIGAALIGFKERRTFSEEDLKQGAQLAQQISLALAKVHLLEEERSRRQEAEKLRQVTATLTSSLNPIVVLEHILDALADVLPYDRSTIFLEEGSHLKVVAFRGNFSHHVHAGMLLSLKDDPLGQQIRRTRRPLILTDASQNPDYQGWNDTSDTRGWMGIPLIAQDRIIGYLAIDSLTPYAYGPEQAHLAQAFANQAATAIENARLYTQEQRALQRSKFLYDIARRLISATNIPDLLQAVATELQKALSAQACSLLLFDIRTMHIEISTHSSTSHRVHTPRPSLLRMGLHGSILEENKARMAVIENPRQETPLLHHMYGIETKHAVMIAPLNVVHNIIGSIIVVNAPNTPPYTTAELDLLTTIANQTAIAIQNLRLVDDLQKSNRDLTLAYDATIEGWSKALELRDKETQGHTLRVTALTLALAEIMGVDKEALVHIRRGALLHDIGKMGIPDAILLKEGGLTAEEWEIMRQHPVYARDMLANISYLRPAMTIPYYHHERWDGSGYPNGLRGQEIPLEARIFAVVDVWDALTSDRPYRESAWDTAKTLRYLQSEAGTLFDPEVVDAFVRLIHTRGIPQAGTS